MIIYVKIISKARVLHDLVQRKNATQGPYFIMNENVVKELD